MRDVVEYTRAGGWVPGDNPWWVELPGKAYGWVIAIPATIVIYVVAWVIQRPCRLIVTVILYLVLRHYYPVLP